jgi:hypothetical protein
MAQLSRPYQIALAAAVAALGLFAMWSLVLHHSSSPEASGGSSGRPAAASAPASPSHAAASSSGTGEGGYGGAIEKAHAAVDESQQNARQLENRSAQASEEPVTAHSAAESGSAAPSASSSKAAAASKAAGDSKTAVSSKAASTHPTATTHKQAPVHANSAQLANQLQATQGDQIKLQLAHGKTVLLLFWNPKSVDDAEVRGQVQKVAAHLKGAVATYVAQANQVGQFGAVTRNVQVLQTPTLLIVGKKGLALTLTGLFDQYAIEQGIKEAAKA